MTSPVRQDKMGGEYSTYGTDKPLPILTGEGNKNVECILVETELLLQWKSTSKQAVKICMVHDIPTLIWTDSSLSLDKSDDSRCYVVSLGK
jgi:hypothetical protein